MWINAALAALLVTTLLAAGFLLARIRSRGGRPLGGRARVQGPCGDAMEIGLRFAGGRVKEVTRRSAGCGHSCLCVDAAARTVVGKTPAEALAVDANVIARCAGGVTDDHRHSAELAAETLHAAVRDYLRRRAGGEAEGTEKG